MALKLGVDIERIIFAPIMPHEMHLERIRCADLVLDTFPYNAHTTASDSLRCGVPLLTLVGESFASRVGASLLNAISLPKLITYSLIDYENSAIELGRSKSKLVEIRKELSDSIQLSGLFNPKLFAKNLESAFQAMIKQHLLQLPPENISIDS